MHHDRLKKTRKRSGSMPTYINKDWADEMIDAVDGLTTEELFLFHQLLVDLSKQKEKPCKTH